MTGMVERPSRMFGSGRKSLPEVREALSNIRVFGRPSRMFESGREAFPDVREWSEGPPKCPKWSGDPFECP